MVNKEQIQEPSIVADPGLDPMSALRQTTQQAQAVTNGTVSNPAIEAGKEAIATNQKAQAALPPVKYSRDGIPEGLDHVSEMERLRAMIQGNTATANDIDNYITLQVKAATEFQRSGEAAAVDNILGGADGGAHQPANNPATPAARGAQRDAAAAGPAGDGGHQRAGAGASSNKPGMAGGQVSSARVESGARAGKPGGGPKQAVAQKHSPKSPVDMSYLSDDESGITTGPKKPAVDMSYLSDPNDGPNVNPYKMASKGMSFENTEREQNIQKAYQSGDREGGRMMLEYSGAKTPRAARLAAAEEDSGAQSVNMPKIVRTGGGAAGSILMNKAAGGLSKAGTRVGQRIGAPSMGEPTMKPMTGKAPAISRPGAQQVGPRPEPRKINVDARPRTEAPAPSQSFTRPPAPKRTEGYSVNTQTDAAVKRNSMTKSQRAADANKKAAEESKLAKAAPKKPAAPKSTTKKAEPKKPAKPKK